MGTDQGSLLLSLCNFSDSLLPSGPLVPDTVPAIPRAPSPPSPAEQGSGTELAQLEAGQRRPDSERGVRKEVTTGDTVASLPDTARAAELQGLLTNSFYDAH